AFQGRMSSDVGVRVPPLVLLKPCRIVFGRAFFVYGRRRTQIYTQINAKFFQDRDINITHH
ncbi:MAG: hypothetical protein LAT84_14570, partial [Balneolia bacterium]|nr:hypothetical protein [Balneolia bacterium]